MTLNRFYDPLYGRIEFTPAEMQLIQSPEIQRLRYVRMCNINSLLISGASQPTRFEHVIGVLHLAKQWTAQNQINGDDASVFHAAALFHDMQTGPFGHSLEYILTANRKQAGDFRHEDIAHGARLKYHQDSEYASAFAGKVFNASGIMGRLWGRVVETISGNDRYGPLISGTLDLDNIDNVVRLAYHVGVATKDDVEIALNLSRDLFLIDGTLTSPSRGLIQIERWQAVRRRLYTLLLHDWAEFSAKAMLTTAIELAVQHNLLASAEWIMTDDELITHLLDSGKGEAQAVGELARGVKSGDLYEPIALWRSKDANRYSDVSQLECKRRIEAAASSESGARFIVHFILDSGKSERAIDVFDRDRDTHFTIGANRYELLIGLFGSKALTASVRERCTAAVKNELEHLQITDLSVLPDPLGVGECASHGQQLTLV